MATVAAVEHQVNELQQALIELARQNDRTARSIDRMALGIDRLSTEMAEFKDETRKANADLRTSLNKQNAELSDALGRLAENILGPSIPTLFKRFFPGSEPEFAMRTLKKHKVSGLGRDFDTPAWNDAVFLVADDLQPFACRCRTAMSTNPSPTPGRTWPKARLTHTPEVDRIEEIRTGAQAASTGSPFAGFDSACSSLLSIWTHLTARCFVRIASTTEAKRRTRSKSHTAAHSIAEPRATAT